MVAIPSTILLCNATACMNTLIGVGIQQDTLHRLRARAAKDGWTATPHDDHLHDHCPEHSKPRPPRGKRVSLRQRLRTALRSALDAPALPALGATSSPLTDMSPNIPFHMTH